MLSLLHHLEIVNLMKGRWPFYAITAFVALIIIPHALGASDLGIRKSDGPTPQLWPVLVIAGRFFYES